MESNNTGMEGEDNPMEQVRWYDTRKKGSGEI
jgi:hypothetical protein